MGKQLNITTLLDTTVEQYVLTKFVNPVVSISKHWNLIFLPFSTNLYEKRGSIYHRPFRREGWCAGTRVNSQFILLYKKAYIM